MPLLNYSSSVPTAKTIAEIHRILVKAGARQVATSYDASQRATGLTFATDTAYGPRTFVLPANVEAVWKVLANERIERRYRTREQAERVAWRIVKDWLEAQLALLEAGMAALDQIMLPYMADEGGRTVYEAYRDRQLALPPPQT